MNYLQLVAKVLDLPRPVERSPYELERNKEELAAGFQMGKKGMPPKNPFEMDTGKEKEDLSWLLG